MPFLWGLTHHRPVVAASARICPVAVVTLPESGKRFSWVTVPGVGTVLNMG